VTTSVGGRDADQHGNTDGKDVSALGGAVGVGMEWGLTRNLSIKTEGLYLFFDQRESLANLEEGCRPGVEGCLTTGSNFFSIDDGFLFRLGANWRFAGGSPDYGSSGALAPYVALRRGPYDWSGFYLGPQVGYGGQCRRHLRNDRTIPETDQAAFVIASFHNRGLLGSPTSYTAGWLNCVRRNDLAAVDWDGLTGDRHPDPPQMAVALDLTSATAHGRLSWSVHNWLVYATGGVAFLDGEFENVSFKQQGCPTTGGG
jgi:opacity protein-like surface antigen